MDQKQETPQAFIKFKKHSFDSHLVKREDNNFKIERQNSNEESSKEKGNKQSLPPRTKSVYWSQNN